MSSEAPSDINAPFPHAGRPRARSQAQGAASWRTADDLQAIGEPGCCLLGCDLLLPAAVQHMQSAREVAPLCVACLVEMRPAKGFAGQRMGINIPPAMAAGMAGGGVAAMGPSAAAAFQHAGGGVNGAMDRPDSMELPEGINLEEARCLLPA